MSRIDNSFKSVTVGAFGLILGYLINFITRRIFVHYLSIEYLGLNGLFFNIFSLLSFAELGIGTAVTYSLYRPLAFGETEKVKALVRFFKKTNYLVGTFFLLAGLALTPFLLLILKDAPDIPHLKIYYMLYIIDMGIGYFLSYKRIILHADQKRYIDNAYRYGFDIGRHILQIIVLIATRQYFLYLFVVLVLNVIENIFARNRINRLYPYLKDPVVNTLDKSDITQIKKNVFALISSKIGTIVVNGTDNLLIVRFVSLASAGIYGGYYMVIIAITNVIRMFRASVLASIGNLVVEEEMGDHYQTFKNLDFFMAWLVGFCSIALFTLLNPFIRLWLGEGYIFSHNIVFALVLNFYMSGVLGSVRTFSESMGLFWFNRYKPLFEAIINLVVSIWLALKLGIIGIFIGTSLSMLLTSTWFEPYVLYRYGLKKSVLSYYLTLIGNTLVALGIGWVTLKVIGLISISNNLINFIVRVGVVALIPNGMYFVLLFRRKEFSYIAQIVSTALSQRKGSFKNN